jgi:hypothetical protein
VGLLLPYLITYLESPLPHPAKKRKEKKRKEKEIGKKREREREGKLPTQKHVYSINLL